MGAGAGTVCFGYKGGIGSASRVVEMPTGQKYTVGVLVQSNFGGELTVAGGKSTERVAREVTTHFFHFLISVPIERRFKDKKRIEKREK